LAASVLLAAFPLFLLFCHKKRLLSEESSRENKK